MRRLWNAIVGACGLLLVVGGIFAFVGEGNNHSACSSALVQATSQNQCQTDNTIYYGSLVAIALGALVIASRIFEDRKATPRRNTGTTPPPPGWYHTPGTSGVESWWDGEKYTHQRNAPLPGEQATNESAEP